MRVSTDALPTAGRFRFVASDRTGRPRITLFALRGVHQTGSGSIHAIRQASLDQAFLAHPNRFKGKHPQPHHLPTEVWINPPKDSNNLNANQPNTLN